MPKILLYITAKVIWNFLFWNTDYREKLLRQWEQFKQGNPIRIIKIKKTK